MALSAKARKRLEVAMARRAEAAEIADEIDRLGAAEAGGSLDEGFILIGNASDEAEAQELSGDVTMDKDGVVTIEALAVTEGKLDDGAVTEDKLGAAAVTAGKAAVFVSTEQTGTGSAQNVAHGLGAIPTLVLVAVTESDGEAFDVAEGAHDDTNVKVTVTADVKFKVLAWA